MPDAGPATRPPDDARPRAHVLAPSGWRRIDFLSDLHLHEGAASTWAAFRHHLAATPADAVFVLGDLVDAWIGDDSAAEPGLPQDLLACLAQTVASGKTVAFLPGNRDFLLGTGGLLARHGVWLLDDPCTLDAFGARWLLSHGDLACVADAPYQRFRAQVRDPAWQRGFLAQPLAERRAFAQRARAASQAAQQGMPPELWADVDPDRAALMLAAAQARVLIHGHTHRPAVHALPGGGHRWVLSDWDLDGAGPGAPPRAGLCCLDAEGLRRVPPAAD